MNELESTLSVWSGVRIAARPNGLKPRLLSSALCLLFVLAAGCSLPLPQAQSDPTKFYVLSAVGAKPVAASEANPVPTAIRIRPIDLASYLQSRPIAVRHGPNEIEFREFARWGEPLDQGIARVLREDLLAHHAAAAVQIGALRPSEVQEVPFELTIRVLAAEGDADGTVNFEAVWQVVNTADNGTVVAKSDFRPVNLHWTPRREATLAAALSQAVDQLAGEVAAQMPK